MNAPPFPCVIWWHCCDPPPPPLSQSAKYYLNGPLNLEIYKGWKNKTNNKNWNNSHILSTLETKKQILFNLFRKITMSVSPFLAKLNTVQWEGQLSVIFLGLGGCRRFFCLGHIWAFNDFLVWMKSTILTFTNIFKYVLKNIRGYDSTITSVKML
jgi:hypothetical protein